VIASQQDNSVKVLETWKGTLVEGAVIQVLELPASPLEVATWEENAAPKMVSGKRMVLFLKHADKAIASPTGETWVGASTWGARASSVWIEAGQAYAFSQRINPGPSALWPMGNESKLMQETLDILVAQTALEKTKALPDATQRASALQPMTTGKYWLQCQEAIAAMGECGAPALPLLHQILKKNGNNSSDVTTALARAARENAGAEMTALLKEELVFWEKEASGLPVGWWNSLNPQDRRQRLQNRYGILQPAIKTVTDLHYLPATKVVNELRDLWISLPQLNDQWGLDKITEACNKALQTLSPPEK
jgi:hypothetical protein